ncbi:hypothetical protein RHSIM_Rhsim03G0216700 [Rhododendron simsii]|uniref:HMA domain-containing protein n=1 Tax=Rhododendron simsii TaxID=118357 RepID=A0A834LU96_RHOSS|nr:hypothetical protein RHSIM_Rhsim03G0216700 [Rhododendron simsii]
MENLQTVPAFKNVEAQYVELKVPLYSCGCEKKVKKALSQFRGIYSVNVDYHQQKVTVWGICNKYDVLATIRNKRKEACFWNPEDSGNDGGATGGLRGGTDGKMEGASFGTKANANGSSIFEEQSPFCFCFTGHCSRLFFFPYLLLKRAYTIRLARGCMASCRSCDLNLRCVCWYGVSRL